MRSTVSIMFAPGWRKMMRMTAGLPFGETEVANVFDGVDDVADIGQADGGAVAGPATIRG